MITITVHQHAAPGRGNAQVQVYDHDPASPDGLRLVQCVNLVPGTARTVDIADDGQIMVLRGRQLAPEAHA